MGLTRRGIVKRRRKRNRDRQKAKKGHVKVNASPVFSLPGKTVDSLGELFEAPMHRKKVGPMITMAANDATTNGLNILVGMGWARTVDAIARNLGKDRILHVLQLEHGAPQAKNVRRYFGQPYEQLRAIRDAAEIKDLSLIFIRQYPDLVLEIFGDHFVPGTTVVLGRHCVLDFYNWCRQNNRELYAVSRSVEPVAVTVVLVN